MEHIVYLIGAGFSAPLGLPVMSNFRFKAEDMYLKDPEKYSYFKSVFDTIRNVSIGKNYYDTDLFNIEEVLSILEMEDFLRGRKFKQKFIDFIVEVIEHHTPEMKPGNYAGNWWDHPFGSGFPWRSYASFVCGLHTRRFIMVGMGRPRNDFQTIQCSSQIEPTARYSVVTLNYDQVLERLCEFVNDTFTREVNAPMVFDIGDGPAATSTGNPVPALAKLHGSTSTRTIVPPTWNKGGHKGIVPAWKLAFKVLSEATQIRILGYSLPTADTYIKYLLKSCVIPNPRLRRIDVICLDPDGSAKRRYDEFIKFNFYRFVSGDIVKYLHAISSNDTNLERREVCFDGIERGHFEFMSSQGSLSPR